MAFSVARNSALLVLLWTLPALIGDYGTYQLGLYLIYAIAAVGVGICWGQLGFLPLGQSVFLGLGAYIAGWTLKGFEESWGVWLVLPLAVVVPALLAWGIGWLVFQRKKESGPYFSLITLALSMLAFQAATSWNSVTGGFNGLGGIPELAGLDSFGSLYYVIAFCLVLVLAGSSWLLQAPLGTLWRAISQNEARLVFLGFHTGGLKALAFGYSAALGGLAGVLYAPHQGLVTPDLCGFLLSAELVIWTAVGGRKTLLGPVLGVLLVGLLTSELRDTFAYWEVLVALIFIGTVLYLPNGLAGIPLPRLGLKKPKTSDSLPIALQPAESGLHALSLQFRQVSSQIGTVRILDRLSFQIERPGIYCMIGPNGAGKTSSFNVLMGELPLESGEVEINKHPLKLPQHHLSRLGISRKFQYPAIFPELTLQEHLSIPLWSNLAKPFQYLDPRLHRWQSEMRLNLRERFPFLKNGHDLSSALSHGERQVLELAMTLVAEPKLLLLDEPCAGLSAQETQQVIDTVREAAKQLGLVVIIIEHDMQLVRELAEHVFVLHQGSLLAEGQVQDIQTNEQVKAVYAGGSKA